MRCVEILSELATLSRQLAEIRVAVGNLPVISKTEREPELDPDECWAQMEREYVQRMANGALESLQTLPLPQGKP